MKDVKSRSYEITVKIDFIKTQDSRICMKDVNFLSCYGRSME